MQTRTDWPGHRALPAFTIHTAVKQAKKAFDRVQNPRVRLWGPTVTGLSIVKSFTCISFLELTHFDIPGPGASVPV